MFNKEELTLSDVKNYILTVAQENGFNESNIIINDFLLKEVKYIVEKYNLPFITHLNFKFSKLKNTGKYKVVPIIPARARIAKNMHKIKKIDIETFEREGKIKILLERKDGAVFSGYYYLSEYYNENSPTWKQKKYKMLQLRGVNDMIGLYIDDYYYDEDMEGMDIEDYNSSKDESTLDTLKEKAFYKLSTLIGTEEEAMNFIEIEEVDMNNEEVLKWILNEDNEGKLVNRIKKYYEKKKTA